MVGEIGQNINGHKRKIVLRGPMSSTNLFRDIVSPGLFRRGTNVTSEVVNVKLKCLSPLLAPIRDPGADLPYRQ